jgi:hypothetical protein
MAQKKATTSRRRSTGPGTRVAPGDPTRRSDSPSSQEIERRAYEIYLSRGGGPGADVDDWLQAERELTTARRDRTD